MANTKDLKQRIAEHLSQKQGAGYEARKEKEAQDKGEEYKSSFINKPVEEAEIIIGKQRSGPIGTVKLDFQKGFTRFIDKEQGGEAPIEVVFEQVADVQRDTIVEMPDII